MICTPNANLDFVGDSHFGTIYSLHQLSGLKQETLYLPVIIAGYVVADNLDVGIQFLEALLGCWPS